MNQELEQIEELSTETLKAHNAAVKNSGDPKNFHKAVKRILAKRRAAEKIHDKEVDDQHEKMGIKVESEEQENFKRAINTVSPGKRTLARKSYRKARDSGQTHAAAMTTMRTMFTEEEIKEFFDDNFSKIKQIQELSNGTLNRLSAARLKQSKALGGTGINNPNRVAAAKAENKAMDAKYRHTEHPDKITPAKPKVNTPEQDAAVKKSVDDQNKKTRDSQNNRGYGEKRYMSDSVEQEELNNQIDETEENIDGSIKGPIAAASAHQGKRKKMMGGTQTLTAKIATILAKVK